MGDLVLELIEIGGLGILAGILFYDKHQVTKRLRVVEGEYKECVETRIEIGEKLAAVEAIATDNRRKLNGEQ